MLEKSMAWEHEAEHRDMEYYQVVHKDNNSYELSLESLDDKYITADKYRKFVEDALFEVSREPFVTSIYQIVVTDDKETPHILVWTNVKQDGSIRPVKSFEFDYIDGSLREMVKD